MSLVSARGVAQGRVRELQRHVQPGHGVRGLLHRRPQPAPGQPQHQQLLQAGGPGTMYLHSTPDNIQLCVDTLFCFNYV